MPRVWYTPSTHDGNGRRRHGIDVIQREGIALSIVINTPNSNIGRKLALTLLDAGESVTVISRDKKKVDELTKRGARVVEGSFDDPAVLAAALKGAKELFWLTPPAHQPDFKEWAVKAGRAAAAAARDAGVERIVILSSIGAHTGPGTGPVGVLRDIEIAFEERHANVVSLRAGFFMENFLRSVETIAKARSIFLPISGTKKWPMVATADIADKAASWLLDSGWRGHHKVGIHGPKGLTLNEAAAVISKELGETVQFVSVSLDQARQGMKGAGMPDFLVAIYAELYGAFDTYRMDVAEPRTPDTTTPTTLAEFTRTVLVPAVRAAR
jgi:uncharacterized protein YbjT (DUF2867 family)